MSLIEMQDHCSTGCDTSVVAASIKDSFHGWREFRVRCKNPVDF